MKRLNKKGFTLVELLAVIVVLALLMVVAASSIGSAMENSRKKTLTITAQKILNDAYAEIQSKKLMGETVAASYPITGKKDYSGTITFNTTTGNITQYCITISKFNIQVSDTVTADGVPTVGDVQSGTCSAAGGETGGATGGTE